MKILYVSCHSTLEWEEVSLLVELGHEVFSNGAYLDPKGNKLLPRPAIQGAKYYPDLEKLAREYPKTHLPDSMIEWADLIIIMHTPEVVTENWDRIKHKKVIWRSIGQSTRHVENMIRRMRYEGLKIIRMSPMEQHIPDYLGADTIIRFYKDPTEFKEWKGSEKRVINFTQSLKARRVFCHHDVLMQMSEGFPTIFFGPGNEDLGALNGGSLPYDLLKGQLRDNRVFIYGGTWPSPYTLALQEAMMTGIPVVAIGKTLAEEPEGLGVLDRLTYYEIPAFIENGINGFISDDIGQLRGYIHELLENYDLAKSVGENGRKTAIDLFGKPNIKVQWKAFIDTL